MQDLRGISSIHTNCRVSCLDRSPNFPKRGNRSRDRKEAFLTGMTMRASEFGFSEGPQKGPQEFQARMIRDYR